MNTNFYGIGGFGGSSFFDSYFGATGSSTNNSAFSMNSMLGDLKMIQSGVYKKALKSYYAQVKTDDEKESISKSGQADSDTSLSSVKSNAKKLNESAKALQNIDYSKVDREDLLSSVKKFASDYNNLLSSTKNLNSYSMLQTAVWATDQMNISEGLLNKVGISIKADNTLAIDEEAFAKAKDSDLKALFSGSGSLAGRIGQKASTLFNQSVNQMATNSGKYTYSMYGTLY
ncbi:MAG: hypothetical protein J1F22_05640 [Lachnospiraceae bacterium]|nr:hypothetical protein [Lachnospiraceae bacterium]